MKQIYIPILLFLFSQSVLSYSDEAHDELQEVCHFAQKMVMNARKIPAFSVAPQEILENYSRLYILTREYEIFGIKVNIPAEKPTEEFSVGSTKGYMYSDTQVFFSYSTKSLSELSEVLESNLSNHGSLIGIVTHDFDVNGCNSEDKRLFTTHKDHLALRLLLLPSTYPDKISYFSTATNEIEMIEQKAERVIYKKLTLISENELVEVRIDFPSILKYN